MMMLEEPDHRSIDVVNVDDSNFRQHRRPGGSNGTTPQNRGNVVMPSRRNAQGFVQYSDNLGAYDQDP
jgi:hypothetical protein